MNIILFLIMTVSAMAKITPEEARKLTGKADPPSIQAIEKEIRRAAVRGEDHVFLEGAMCSNLAVLEKRGFNLYNPGCALFEYGGRCDCVVKW